MPLYFTWNMPNCDEIVKGLVFYSKRTSIKIGSNEDVFVSNSTRTFSPIFALPKMYFYKHGSPLE